jgi:formylglycine-generating enzyme required for sulfatase activity
VYADKSEGHAWPVGSKKPNDFGLFDMHGNAAEWCEDRFIPLHSEGGETPIVLFDPREPIEDADVRVVRGGSYLDGADRLHASARDSQGPATRQPDCGFRVVRAYP